MCHSSLSHLQASVSLSKRNEEASASGANPSFLPNFNAYLVKVAKNLLSPGSSQLLG